MCDASNLSEHFLHPFCPPQIEDSYNLLAKIGEGTYGVVHKATHKQGFVGEGRRST